MQSVINSPLPADKTELFTYFVKEVGIAITSSASGQACLRWQEFGTIYRVSYALLYTVDLLPVIIMCARICLFLKFSV